MPIDTRKLDRDSMFLMANLTLADADEQILRVRVRNLSAGGMKVEGDVPVTRGQEVMVTLRNIGTVPGTVVWVRGTSFGVAFATEIDPKLARIPVAGGEKEAPGYARAALSAPRHDGWNGKLRRI